MDGRAARQQELGGESGEREAHGSTVARQGVRCPAARPDVTGTSLDEVISTG
ncbi:hypothetical protein HLK56_33070 [Streptomyces sp. G9]|uniref:hypothetical protein n=1 Tax=Streptomyces sp. G9 TaxID=1684483 RepID=UPI003D71CEC9